jgi:hypothetical protein
VTVIVLKISGDMEGVKLYYPSLDINKINEIVDDVIVKDTTRPQREFVIHTFSEEVVKQFHEAIKKEVNKLYGKGRDSREKNG